MRKPPSPRNKKLIEKNEDRYRLLIDSVQDYAIFMLDPQGYITSWNTGAKKLKGYCEEEIIHQHFSIFYPEEALKRNHPAYELKKAKKEGKYEEEGWRVRKDGSQFWANVVISAIYDSNHKFIGFSKVTQDLTERKKLQDELSESEEQSRLLISVVKDYAIFLLTPEGKVASWNEGAKRINGYTAKEIIGCSFSKFYPAKVASSRYPEFELAKALEDGRFEDEGWRVRKDGSQYWANVTITPIYNHQNHHIGYTKITRDLSEHNKNEALMRKNKELHQVNTDLDNFVYTASHDLKAPITNLEGLFSLVERIISPKLNETENQVIEKMRASLLKLQDTIESIIKVTKAQKNLEEEKELVSFQEVLAEVKGALRQSVVASKAKIREDLQEEELTFAKASLKSILYNLLSNAIKYRSPERQPEINLSTKREGGHIILSVKDNGLGLSKAHQAKLFSMFKRFHRHVEGTGIGLYIVKRTIENYGGKVQVKSKLNEGTEFKLYFNA